MRILHADLDAFFASVEIVDDPSLKGHPVVVGGQSERGVVATCNYEARKHGIHSAMPAFMAKDLCPEAIFIRPRMDRYKEVSRVVFEIFRAYTDTIEPLSIDEAFLDITEHPKSTRAIIQEIKWKVYQKTKLTISIGVSYNKFLAKLASDMNKPNGYKIIEAEEVKAILFPLPIGKVYGLGKKSTDKLNGLGIYTIEDLYALEKDVLKLLLGQVGHDVYYRIRGIDHRKVSSKRKSHSFGTERTLEKDLEDLGEIRALINEDIRALSKQLHKKNIKCRTLTLKYKTIDFKSYTKSKTLTYAFDSEKEMLLIMDIIF